ncbi:hypothetical protein [Umezawaea beigongshangensis]|uniref:hypothetical protein n=1 Tax=Umezawaea beigongshangensis TaxID=2780383 RepID=UPI0018F1CA29|nr:hypothetical protein [Umezawaea beigongshangensis]
MTGSDDHPDRAEVRPRLTATWQIGLATLVVAVALAVTATFATIYTYAQRDPAGEPYRVVATLWQVRTISGTTPYVPRAHGVLVVVAAALLLASLLPLLASSGATSTRAKAAARSLTLAASAFLCGTVWIVDRHTATLDERYTSLDTGVLFTQGSGLEALRTAALAAVVGGVLVLPRARRRTSEEPRLPQPVP